VRVLLVTLRVVEHAHRMHPLDAEFFPGAADDVAFLNYVVMRRVFFAEIEFG
jgi:hypothetical protein